MSADHVNRQPKKSRPGVGLMIAGAIIALGFAAFLLFTSDGGFISANPLWIAVIWGVLMMVYGAYRAIRGKSRLDHPRGGTDADGH